MELTELFTSVANAIRDKKGTEEKILATDFPKEIEELETRGAENTVLNDEVLRTPNDFGNFVSTALEAIQYINGKLNVNGRHDYKRMFRNTWNRMS